MKPLEYIGPTLLVSDSHSTLVHGLGTLKGKVGAFEEIGHVGVNVRILRDLAVFPRVLVVRESPVVVQHTLRHVRQTNERLAFSSQPPVALAKDVADGGVVSEAVADRIHLRTDTRHSPTVLGSGNLQVLRALIVVVLICQRRIILILLPQSLRVVFP